MSGRAVALQLPAPVHCAVPSGAVVWAGGVRVLGEIVCIPGRAVHADDLEQAEQHAAAVLAACAAVREERARRAREGAR